MKRVDGDDYNDIVVKNCVKYDSKNATTVVF